MDVTRSKDELSRIWTSGFLLGARGAVAGLYRMHDLGFLELFGGDLAGCHSMADSAKSTEVVDRCGASPFIGPPSMLVFRPS